MSASGLQETAATGWEAGLQLEYALKNNRTVLKRNEHYGPLAVQRPLYPEDKVCHTYVLHPPGGIVGGDRLHIALKADAGCNVLITTPGATKFYRSANKEAVQQQYVRVCDNAVVEWLPQDSIFFPGANARVTTRIELESSSRLIGWEILCLGLPAVNEHFASGSLLAGLEVYRCGAPLLLDRLRILEDKDLARPAGLRSFPVSATLVATVEAGATAKVLLERVRSIPPEEKKALSGLTLMDGLLVVRYLGHATFAARDFFIRIWKELRPIVTGVEPCTPRIWAT